MMIMVKAGTRVAMMIMIMAERVATKAMSITTSMRTTATMVITRPRGLLPPLCWTGTLLSPLRRPGALLSSVSSLLPVLHVRQE